MLLIRAQHRLSVIILRGFFSAGNPTPFPQKEENRKIENCVTHKSTIQCPNKETKIFHAYNHLLIVRVYKY